MSKIANLFLLQSLKGSMTDDARDKWLSATTHRTSLIFRPEISSYFQK
jgi:hypothetical protein